eukprot:TRINITY_DN1913_c0_g1_i1.p1 TRINITY_DN1913_c0_g1~~TRINITY_DN1913_c0_g1_i1.p1  ORF type:complete len:127 (+),score=33.77 TRINITY_DN1913_c0_g1_i1:9-389(+)
MNSAHHKSNFSYKGSTLDIYQVDSIMATGGRVITFYVLEKKQNGQERYYINLYGDSSNRYWFSRVSKNLDDLVNDLNNQPQNNNIGLITMSSIKYNFPILDEIKNGLGENSVEEITTSLKNFIDKN